MILLALLFAVSQSVVTVPPAHWTAIDLKVPQNNSTVQLFFEVREQDSPVQAIVLSREEAGRFQQGRPNRPLVMSGFGKSDRLRVPIPDAGDYVLLLDNRLEEKAAHVAIRLEVSHPDDLEVRTVPAARQRATEALSLLFLGAVVVFSAVKFLRN